MGRDRGQVLLDCALKEPETGPRYHWDCSGLHAPDVDVVNTVVVMVLLCVLPYLCLLKGISALPRGEVVTEVRGEMETEVVDFQ